MRWSFKKKNKKKKKEDSIWIKRNKDNFWTIIGRKKCISRHIEINFTNDIKIAYLGVHTIFIDISIYKAASRRGGGGGNKYYASLANNWEGLIMFYWHNDCNGYLRLTNKNALFSVKLKEWNADWFFFFFPFQPEAILKRTRGDIK